jgi:hypothetical protein
MIRIFSFIFFVQLLSLSAQPVAKIGDLSIKAESLHLIEVDQSLSHEEVSALKQKNTRALVSYLENYFIEQYLEDAGNPVTGDEVEQKVDELLLMTYGTAENLSEEYGKQVKRMAEILPLLKAHIEEPEKAESLYSENYSGILSRSEWDQLKRETSSFGLEQTIKVIESKLPTDEDIRNGYRGQAYASVFNEKFSDVWGNTDLKYSDWRKERFSEVQILDADYFDVEKLTAWFGYDRSSAEIEDVKQVVSEIPATPPAPEAEEVAQEPTARQPATEKPDEVKTPDTTEEPVEQSSNWLWLIGLLVVVGGLAVVVGRKS